MTRKRKSRAKETSFGAASEGRAEPGVELSPAGLSEEADPNEPRAAPCPGVPVSEEEYSKLKRKAEGKKVRR